MERITLDGFYPPFGPSLYWALDSTNGAVDLSGIGRSGTGAGGVTVGGAADAPPGVNGSTDFDGSDDRITSTYNPFVAGTTRTFTGWAYRDGSSANHALFGGTGANRPVLLLVTGTQNVRFDPDQSGATAGVTWTSAWPGNTQWAHWALVFNDSGDTVSLYINGALVSAQALTDAYGATTGDFEVGAFSTSTSPFDGKMAHVAVYERALTSGEIGSIYELGAREFNKRSELDITPWVSQEGADWGEATIEAFMSSQQVGAVPVDYDIPNRPVSIPLSLRDVGGTTFASVRSLVQAKVGTWQQRGGRLKRVLNGGGTVWADVASANLRLSGDWLQAHNDADVGAELACEVLPDFYEQEEALSDHTETTLPEITFTESTANGGDFPLGDRVRIVVDDDQGQNQRGLIWAFRGSHYSSASTAATAYEAEALENLDTATKVAMAGASGGTVITHGTISTNWTPVVGTRIGGATYLTHTGTNRFYARVFSTSGTAVEARFVYDVGDLINPVENTPVRLYDGGTFHILDLGEARLDPSPIGPHRWRGQIQARGAAGGEAFSVDRVWIVNEDDSSGVLRAPSTNPRAAIQTYSARSNFTTESGAITGDSLQVGGTWTGAGDADDFTVAGGVATRTAVSDASININDGRLIVASGATLTSSAAQVDFRTSAIGGFGTPTPNQGVLLRYTNISNFLAAYVTHNSINSARRLTVIKRIGGVTTTVKSVPLSYLFTATWYTLLATVDSGGAIEAWVGPQGLLPATPQLTASDGTLATGGSLASGKLGIVDHHANPVATTRDYTNFFAWTIPNIDAVAFASQSVDLTTEGIAREESGGIAYGPVASVYGDLPRIPNQSTGGTVEVFAKPSRGDLEVVADSGIDDVSVRVYRRPTWLTVS